MYNLIVQSSTGKIHTTNFHLYKMLDYLCESDKYKKIDLLEMINKSENEIRNILINKFNEIPQNIIFIEHLSDINEIKIPTEIKINVLIDDLHHQGQIKRKRLKNLSKISKIFSTYAYCYLKYYPEFKSLYFLPHAATYIIEYNESPKNKILITGRLNKEIYPFRNLMYQISKYNTFLEYLPVKCGYEIEKDSNDLIYGERYIKKLNEYLACFTCDANADRPYIVAKHFEILISGSLLLAGNPNTKKYFEKLGFIDGVHYISASIENIHDKIDFIVNPENRDKINEIRRNGHNFAKKHHTYISRGDYLKRILDDNDNGELQTDGINDSTYYMEKNSNHYL